MATRIEQIKQMLVQEPNDVFLHYALGIEYVALQETQKAIDIFTDIILKDKNYLAAYYQLGKCFEQLNLPDRAIATYAQGTEVAKQQGKTKTLNELNEAIFLLED